MWKNFLNGKKRSAKTVEVLNSFPKDAHSKRDSESELSSDEDGERNGMYEVNKISGDEQDGDDDSDEEENSLIISTKLISLPRAKWQEKYEFLLSLISEPRFLVRDALTAEELKLTLKLQAFQLEKTLVFEALSSVRQSQGNEEPFLRQQLKKLNENLTVLECRLEVLRSVQHALPDDLMAPELVFPNNEEFDSLESHSEKRKEDLLSLLRIEKLAHRATRRDLEWLRKQYDRIREDLETKDPRKTEETESVDDKKDQTSLHLAEEIQKRDLLVAELQRKIIEMERDREERKETDKTALMKQLELENEELRKVNDELKNQVHSRTQSINSDSSVDSSRVEPIGSELENPPIAIIEATQLPPVTIDEEKEESRVTRRRTYKISSSESPEVKQLRKLLNEMQQKEVEYLEKIKTLENNKKNSNTGETLVLKKQISTLERRLKEAEKQVDVNKKNSLSSMEELSDLKYECEVLRKENKRLTVEVENLRTREREHANCARTISALEKEFRLTLEMNKIMYEDLNRERLLRKKYYNMVEEMKGKIRVCCRIRPITTRERQHSPAAVVEIIDSYSLRIDTKSGAKEFQFDKVYGPDDNQEKVFADTSALIQSAFDGYNVCICAYGQTGSGKTFTIVGDESNPGLAPRTFERIFQLAEEYSQQFITDVSMYMVELHNDRLIDLLKSDGNNEEKLEIKKDKKGVVWIQGCSQVSVPDAPTLLAYFARGTENRHTAFTRMNEKSSRSHLVVGIAIECTSHLHGTKTKGKVSLLDLAGSERVSKSGVSSDSLKETTFINKSLSALGDVISALTTAQEFIPYRNSKLTMLMQDSLGGNAKTLMFVNASPAAYNLEETLNSLTYASRVKQITNSASKLAESKEITKLKTIISKMRRGESVDYLESIS